MYEVVIGRKESERKELGLRGTIFIGKLYVKMGATTSLSNKIFMDVAKAHIILVCGKRGSGKCVTGDTLISLEDGSLVPIKLLENKKLKVLSLDDKLKISKIDQFYQVFYPNHHYIIEDIQFIPIFPHSIQI